MWVAAIWAATGTEVSGLEMTMSEAVECALQNNLELKAERGNLSRAEAERVRAKRIPNPSLQYELVSGKGKGTSSGTITPPPILGKRSKIAHIPVAPGEVASFTTVELSQRVEIGLQRGLRKRIAETNVVKVSAEIEDAERLLEGQVRRAFWDVLHLRKEAALADTAVAINDELLEIAQSRFQAGETSELEVKLARMEAMRARNRRTDAMNHLALAKIELNRLLGRSPMEPLTVVEEPEPQLGPLDLSHLIERALENRRDLESLKLEAKKTKEELTLARRERLPDLHLSFVYEKLAGTEMFGGAVTLPIPIFDRNQGQVAASIARGRQARIQFIYRRELIQKEVTAAFEKLNASKHRLRMFEEGILNLAEDNLGMMRTAYQLGESDIFGIIRAQERFLEVRAQHLHAMHDFNDAVVELETAVGARLKDISPSIVIGDW